MEEINKYLDKILDSQQKVTLYNNVKVCTLSIDCLEGKDHNVFGLVIYDNNGDVIEVKLLTVEAVMGIYFGLDRLLGYDTFSNLDDEDDDGELE